jgi:putative oxidoreductase
MATAVTVNPALPLLGRILIALLFLVAGIRKALAFAGTAGYFAKLGLPAPEIMTALAIAVEIGGAVLLILGWRTRWVAWVLIVFTVVATYLGHKFWIADAPQYGNQLNHFLKNVAVIGGLLMLSAFGPGRASADRL